MMDAKKLIMANQTKFITQMQQGYRFSGSSLPIGVAMYQGKVVDVPIQIPLKTLNRHGLVAGATGTGKTKSVQLLTEGLSKQGVPVLLMDLKGDLSGLAAAGKVNATIEARQAKIGVPYQPMSFPVELLRLSEQPGVKLRATVSEFGPLLFSKILQLNATQESIVALIFKISDDYQLPLLDLKDFKKVLNFVINEGKAQVTPDYGTISKASAGTILRKVIELEQQGANNFFGEPSFEVNDLLQVDSKGNGYISILRLTDLQDRPKLFSTFMLSLLAEIYQKFPETGDLDKPKLILFIDEAHLLFKKASPALLDQIENIVKLIRSKGVGIFFCTQNPTDIPASVLSQLGMKLQHALRAFTAKDRKAIKLTAENYPSSEFYQSDDLLTSLGIGEALVTVLDEKGRPTPLVATFLSAPQSRMGPLNAEEIAALVAKSDLVKRYNISIDRTSAYEILNQKMAAHQVDIPASKSKQANNETWVSSLSKNTMIRQLGRTFIREISRGLLGVLGFKTAKGRRKSSR